MALTRMEDGLGPTSKGSQVGESSHGLAIIRRLHERREHNVQDEGGCHQLCKQAGI